MPTHRHSPAMDRALLALGVFTFASWTLAAALLLAWAPARGAVRQAATRVAAAWPLGRTPPARHAHEGALAPLALPVRAFSPVAIAASAPGPAFAYGFDGDGEDGFSWSISGGEPGSAPRDARFRFSLDGEDYVVRDPAIVAEAQRAAEPLREAGREMGEVGREMGRQGAEMGRLGGRMGAASARMAAMQARLAAGDASRASREELRARLGELRAEMAKLRDEMSSQRAAHADQQQALSRRMSELSERHREVMRSVREQVREIARRAVREGKAERPHANA